MTAYADLMTTLSTKPVEVRADFVGWLAFTVIEDLDVAALPAAMRVDLDAFIARAAFEDDDTAERTQERIAAHLAAHPIAADLVALFERLSTEIGDAEAADADGRGRSASAVLGTAESLTPVGASGRKEGTMAGGLLGLVAARTQPRAPVAPAPTPSASPDMPAHVVAPPDPNAPKDTVTR